jgi:hypothetical protein
LRREPFPTTTDSFIFYNKRGRNPFLHQLTSLYFIKRKGGNLFLPQQTFLYFIIYEQHFTTPTEILESMKIMEGTLSYTLYLICTPTWHFIEDEDGSRNSYQHPTDMIMTEYWRRTPFIYGQLTFLMNEDCKRNPFLWPTDIFNEWRLKKEPFLMTNRHFFKRNPFLWPTDIFNEWGLKKEPSPTTNWP